MDAILAAYPFAGGRLKRTYSYDEIARVVGGVPDEQLPYLDYALIPLSQAIQVVGGGPTPHLDGVMRFLGGAGNHGRILGGSKSRTIAAVAGAAVIALAFLLVKWKARAPPNRIDKNGSAIIKLDVGTELEFSGSTRYEGTFTYDTGLLHGQEPWSASNSNLCSWGVYEGAIFAHYIDSTTGEGANFPSKWNGDMPGSITVTMDQVSPLFIVREGQLKSAYVYRTDPQYTIAIKPPVPFHPAGMEINMDEKPHILWWDSRVRTIGYDHHPRENAEVLKPNEDRHSTNEGVWQITPRPF